MQFSMTTTRLNHPDLYAQFHRHNRLKWNYFCVFFYSIKRNVFESKNKYIVIKKIKRLQIKSLKAVLITKNLKNNNNKTLLKEKIFFVQFLLCTHKIALCSAVIVCNTKTFTCELKSFEFKWSCSLGWKRSWCFIKRTEFSCEVHM